MSRPAHDALLVPWFRHGVAKIWHTPGLLEASCSTQLLTCTGGVADGRGCAGGRVGATWGPPGTAAQGAAPGQAPPQVAQASLGQAGAGRPGILACRYHVLQSCLRAAWCCCSLKSKWGFGVTLQAGTALYLAATIR